MLGNFGVFSFLRSWKLIRFLTTCISATSFKIWTFISAFLYISETTRTNFFKIFSHILRTDEKSALQHSLFWRYANFSKLTRTIHISMTSTLQCEYYQCFTFKCNKFKLTCTSHGGMYSAHYFGTISFNVKTVNVVTQIFDRFVG